MYAMFEKGSNLHGVLYVKIHIEYALESHLSFVGSHFVNVNILGIYFLSRNKVFPIPY